MSERSDSEGNTDKARDKAFPHLHFRQCYARLKFMPIEHPYQNLEEGIWLKGNLHTHSTRSDGSHDPQTVIDLYAGRNYDFLMLSDHDVYTSESDYSAINDQGLTLIPGNEISRSGVHILHVHADGKVDPHENRQQVIDEINGGRGFAIVAHPNWYKEFDHCRHEQLCEWRDYVGLEIYNGVIGRLEGSPYATNHWDRLLGNGRRVFGYAHDDFHNTEMGDLEQGWNMVCARERSVEAIVAALRSGCFYASTGVMISSIEISGNRVRIETANAQRIVTVCNTARRLAVCDDRVATIDVPENVSYVRFECWGAGEQFAWTQPCWITV